MKILLILLLVLIGLAIAYGIITTVSTAIKSKSGETTRKLVKANADNLELRKRMNIIENTARDNRNIDPILADIILHEVGKYRSYELENPRD